MTADLWDRLENAYGTDDAVARQIELRSVLDLAVGDNELRATALAILAFDDREALGLAIDSVPMTSPVDDVNADLRLIHLANACLRWRDFDNALRAIRLVNHDLLVDSDLRWRGLEALDIEAASLLRTGSVEAAIEKSDQLFQALRDEVDSDPAPPAAVVLAALEIASCADDRSDGAVTLLQHLVAFIELQEWFPPSTVSEIAALAGS